MSDDIKAQDIPTILSLKLLLISSLICEFNPKKCRKNGGFIIRSIPKNPIIALNI